jgi:hypothetical protein
VCRVLTRVLWAAAAVYPLLCVGVVRGFVSQPCGCLGTGEVDWIVAVPVGVGDERRILSLSGQCWLFSLGYMLAGCVQFANFASPNARGCVSALHAALDRVPCVLEGLLTGCAMSDVSGGFRVAVLSNPMLVVASWVPTCV